jgi:pimeloyl-ACP methyl ester carboxylesterase
VTARAAAALILVVLCTSACGGRERPDLIPLTGDPGHLIEVNGHRLYFKCIGAGEPTLLLEAGYGSDHHAWDVVEPELVRTSRTCEYDRAGLGFSGAEQPKPRGPLEQLDDLEDLLDGARIVPPYVVVGHSYGGILAWLFTREHRDDVAGLVLVDSAHPQQQKRFLAFVPRPSQPEQVSPENVRLSGVEKAVGDLGSIGDTRLVVLTAGQEDTGDLPKRLAARVVRTWRQLQDDYAARSTDSLHVIARYSPHFIQSNLGQPELVVDAVREVVAAARAGRGLRPCERLFRPPGARCLSSPGGG